MARKKPDWNWSNSAKELRVSAEDLTTVAYLKQLFRIASEKAGWDLASIRRLNIGHDVFGVLLEAYGAAHQQRIDGVTLLWSRVRFLRSLAGSE